MTDSRLVVSLVVAALVAFQIVCLTNVVIRAHHPLLGGTMFWLDVPPVRCGQWPDVDVREPLLQLGVDPVAADGLRFACTGDAVHEMPGGPEAVVNGLSCMRWCRAGVDQPVVPGAWCCQLSLAPVTCKWYNGSVALVETSGPVLAYEACPVPESDSPPVGHPGALGAPLTLRSANTGSPRTRGPTRLGLAPPGAEFDPPTEIEAAPVPCPEGTNGSFAMLRREGPRTCSQLCLPSALEDLALAAGAVRGSCREQGCAVFLRSMTAQHVLYSVFACQVPDRPQLRPGMITNPTTYTRDTVPDPGGTLRWLSPEGRCSEDAAEPAPGAGLAAVRACSSGHNWEEMPAPRSSALQPVNNHSCAAWCRSKGCYGCCAAEPVGHGRGERCTWCDGTAVVPWVKPREGAETRVIPFCPGDQEGQGPVAPAISRSWRAWRDRPCPDGSVEDAMVLDGEGPGMCSQVCLPLWLWPEAQRHGVRRGSCRAQGYALFHFWYKTCGVMYAVFTDVRQPPPYASKPETMVDRFFKAFFPPGKLAPPPGPAPANDSDEAGRRSSAWAPDATDEGVLLGSPVPG